MKSALADFIRIGHCGIDDVYEGLTIALLKR
jgi:hypothetical protein